MEDHSSADSSPKGLGGERDFPVQHLCGCLWLAEIILDSCSLSHFYFLLSFLVGSGFCFLFWVGFFESEWNDTAQSETIIQFQHNPHFPMVNHGHGFPTPRLRCQIGSILSRTPLFWSIFFVFSERERRVWMEDYSWLPFCFSCLILTADWDFFVGFHSLWLKGGVLTNEGRHWTGLVAGLEYGWEGDFRPLLLMEDSPW